MRSEDSGRKGEIEGRANDDVLGKRGWGRERERDRSEEFGDKEDGEQVKDYEEEGGEDNGEIYLRTEDGSGGESWPRVTPGVWFGKCVSD